MKTPPLHLQTRTKATAGGVPLGKHVLCAGHRGSFLPGWAGGWDWRGFLFQALSEAQSSRRGCVVLQPGVRKYTDPEGVYAGLRAREARRSLRRRLWRGGFVAAGRGKGS
jgi:hypothetical protein